MPGLKGSHDTSSSSGASYRSSNNNRYGEMDYSPEFYGKSHYAETCLYYDISRGRRPVPSLEVEGDTELNIRGQFCDIVYPNGTQGWSRLAVDVITYPSVNP